MPSASASNMDDKYGGIVPKNTNFLELLAPNLTKQSTADQLPSRRVYMTKSTIQS